MSTPVLSFRAKSGDVQVDLQQLIAGRALIQANSGGGKSRLLRQMCEQLHGQVQIIILDPEGEFASLREKFDFLLAGRDGDVPTDPKTAKLFARRLLELKASAIVDLYDLKLPDRRRYVRLFLEEMANAPRTLWHACVLVIDEAHVFCPERGSGDAESTDAVITLCTQGRKRGFAPVLATQRISKLHKDAAAELLNKFIGRTGLDVDMKRAGDELGLDKDGRHTLRDLSPGEFYAFGPAVSRAVLRVRGGEIATTHPKAGEIAPPAPPAPAAIRKLLAQVQDLAKESAEEARSIEDLQKQLAGAKAELRRVQRGTTAAAPDPAVVQKQIDAAVTRARREWDVDESKRIAERQRIDRQLRGQISELQKRIESMGRTAAKIVESAGLPVPEIVSPPASRPSSDPQVRVARTAVPRPAAAPRAVANVNPSTKLPPGETAVLTACCQYPAGCTREQLTVLTGYKRSSRDAYIQRLRGRELVDVVGDRIVAREGAQEVLGDFTPLPTGEALQQYWLDRLPPGERAILEVLLAEHPEEVSRDELTDRTEYKRSSRDAYIQRMKAKQIIVVSSSGVSAADFLFEGWE